MKFAVTMLAASVAIGVFAATAKADTTETTTVQTTSTSVALPTTSTYVVIDPVTGVSRGAYDPVTRLLNGAAIPNGYYVVDQPTGRVMATVDTTGNLVSFTTVPTVLPQHFTVVNGQMIYFESDYALRRATLETKIDDQYRAGHLSAEQVKKLKQGVSEITQLQTKTKSNGTLKESTRKEIERKFAMVEADYNKDVAKINDKRAKIGITN